MKLDDIDTKKLRYNPKSKNFIKQLCEDIPEFAAYSGHGRKKLPKDKVCGFIAVLYDINSPMAYEVLDYYEKKSEAADMFDFDRKEDGEWEEYVEDMLLGQNKEVNELIAAFIAQFGSSEYIRKIAYTEMLRHETIQALSQKNTKETYSNIDKLTSNLKEVDRMLYQSGKKDEIAEARSALYARAVRDKIKIRPEEIVEILENDGELPSNFDQYPSLKGKDKKPDLHYYNETKEEREERKQREKEDTTVKKDETKQP